MMSSSTSTNSSAAGPAGLFSKDSISKFVVEEFRAHSRVIGGALLPAAKAGHGTSGAEIIDA
jgi:hypothetical protein